MMIKNKEQQKRVSEFLYEHRNSLKIPLPEIKSNIENDFLINFQTLNKIIEKSDSKTLRTFFKTYFYYKITENLNYSLPHNYDVEELYYKGWIHANSNDSFSEIKEFYTYVNYLTGNGAKMKSSLEEDEIKELDKISKNMIYFYRNFKSVENFILGDSSYFQDLPYQYIDYDIIDDHKKIIENPYLIKIKISYKNIYQNIDFQKLRSIVLFSFGDSKNYIYEIKNMIVALAMAKKLRIGIVRNAKFIIIFYPLENKYFYCETVVGIDFAKIINDIDNELKD